MRPNLTREMKIEKLVFYYERIYSCFCPSNTLSRRMRNVYSMADQRESDLADDPELSHQNKQPSN